MANKALLKNYEQAFKWLTVADQNGSMGAKYSLGMMYYTGTGVEKDAKRAFDYFTKAAAKDHAKAQYNLGVLYDRGEGTAQDYGKAFEWFSRAAEQGYPPAEYNLAQLYKKVTASLKAMSKHLSGTPKRLSTMKVMPSTTWPRCI